jgi:phage tail-like protein
MAVGDRKDPYRSYHYRLELNNTAVAGFSEISGLTNDVDPIEYREGNDPLHVRKLSGLRKYANIMLKRGYTDNRDLLTWYAAAQNGAIERRNGAIILMNEDREDVLRWEFKEGWPCKYEGPSFNATGNEVAIESLEICHEQLTLEFI